LQPDAAGDFAMERCDGDLLIASDPEVVGCVLGEGAALLNLRTNIYYSLDEVGSFVWDALEQPVAFEGLVQRVLAEFDVAPNVAQRDLARLIGRLDSAGLVQCTHP
jgi:hypothetical protein